MKTARWLLPLLSLLLFVSFAIGQEVPAAEEAPETSAEAPELSSETMTKIRGLLSGYEFFPTKDDLLIVTEHAPYYLMAIVEDEEAMPSMRNRAIDALGYFEDLESRAFVEGLLERHESLPSTQLHHALSAYSKIHKGESVERLSVFLDHDDVQIRITAVDALRKHGGEAGELVLTKRLDIEKHELVLKQIKKGY